MASRWPDRIEPASRGPRHRSYAHGVGAGALIASLPIGEWQVGLRAKGAEYDALAAGLPENAAMRAVWRILAWCCYALAGLIAGMQAGYLSHLVADALTPASLPILG
jgi:hypothetical protein